MAQATRPPPQLPSEIIVQILVMRVQADLELNTVIAPGETLKLATVSHMSLETVLSVLEAEHKALTRAQEEVINQHDASCKTVMAICMRGISTGSSMTTSTLRARSTLGNRCCKSGEDDKVVDCQLRRRREKLKKMQKLVDCLEALKTLMVAGEMDDEREA